MNGCVLGRPAFYLFILLYFFCLLFLLEALQTDEESCGFLFLNLWHCAHSGERLREEEEDGR